MQLLPENFFLYLIRLFLYTEHMTRKSENTPITISYSFSDPEALNRQLRRELESLAETDFQKFSAALVPGEMEMLGVRLPKLREIARILAKGDWKTYLAHASDKSMEEIMLQGMTLGYARSSFQEKKPWLKRIIPKIRNWSLCDSICVSMKFPKAEAVDVWEFLQPYLQSSREYDIRFAVVMILAHFIQQEYLEKIFSIFDEINHEGYYVKMAVAWAVSVCFRNFKEETLAYLQNCRLDDWTFNKSLQKIIESRYSSKEEKELMRRMKRR